MSFSISSRKISIFLSSTFKDMQAERTYLVKEIFPFIKRECLKRNIEFSVIDLRWGLLSENEGSIIDTCLDLIDKTNPFFIGILGDRYGWVPLKNDIINDTKLVHKHPEILDYAEHNLSITEIEMRHGALDRATNANALFFLRKNKRKYKAKDVEEYDKLSALKQSIIEASMANKCQVDEYSNPRDLGKTMLDKIMDIINRLYPVDANLNECQIILQKQECKWKELQNVYIDFAERHKTLNSYINKAFSDNLPAIIVGDNGCGKSALLANYSTDDYSLIRIMIDDTICDLHILIQLFEEAKKQVQNSSKPILWIIDGLEKLSVRISDLKFLFEQDCYNLVLSMNYEMYKKLWNCYDIATAYEIPLLNEKEVRCLIVNNLDLHSKELINAQLAFICTKEFLKNPTLCKVFINHLVQFGLYEELDQYISKILNADNGIAFVSNIISSIESDFGQKEVAHILSFLGVFAVALPEQSLCSASCVPISKWIPIQSALGDLIVYEGGYVMGISILRDAIMKAYFPKGYKLSLCLKTVKILKKENDNLLKKNLIGRGKKWIKEIALIDLKCLSSIFHFPLQCENENLQLRREKNILNIIKLLYHYYQFHSGSKYLDRHYCELNDFPVQRNFLLVEALKNGVFPSRFIHATYNVIMDDSEFKEFVTDIYNASKFVYAFNDSDWKRYSFWIKVFISAPDGIFDDIFSPFRDIVLYSFKKDKIDINSWLLMSYIHDKSSILTQEATSDKKNEDLPSVDISMYLLDISDVESIYNGLLSRYSELHNITDFISKTESESTVPWYLPMYAFCNLRLGNIAIAKQISLFLHRKGIPFLNLDFEIAYSLRDLMGLEIALEDINDIQYESPTFELFKIQCKILYGLALNETSGENSANVVLELLRLTMMNNETSIINRFSHWLMLKKQDKMSSFLEYIFANQDTIRSCRKVFEEFTFLSFIMQRKDFFILDLLRNGMRTNMAGRCADVFEKNGIIIKKVQGYKVNQEKINEYLLAWGPPFRHILFDYLLDAMKMKYKKSTLELIA